MHRPSPRGAVAADVAAVVVAVVPPVSVQRPSQVAVAGGVVAVEAASRMARRLLELRAISI